MAALLSISPSADATPPLPDPTEQKIRNYFEGDSKKQAELRKGLKALPPLKDAAVDRWVKFAFSESKRRARADGKAVQNRKHPMKYVIQGTPTKGGPLLIYLHGGGPGEKKINDYGWAAGQRMARFLRISCVVIPRVLDDKSPVGWWSEKSIRGVEELIREMVRTHGVDTNRIYLGGSSMGGWGISTVGPILADRAAAIYSSAGGAHPQGALSNLRNTPFIIHIGDQDKAFQRLETTRRMHTRLKKLKAADAGGYEVEYKEFKGKGHNLGTADHTTIGTWLKKKKRTPFPRVIVWKPETEIVRVFSWLAVDDSENGFGKPIRAEIAKGNIIRITNGRKPMTVFLHKEMVDLRKPVTVQVDGKVGFRGTVRPHLSAIVESIEAKEDPVVHFTHRIDLK